MVVRDNVHKNVSDVYLGSHNFLSAIHVLKEVTLIAELSAENQQRFASSLPHSLP